MQSAGTCNMSYKTLERHISPDEVLTFSVLQYEDGDTSLGFEGFNGHTHGDILAALSGLSEDKAIRQYTDDLLNNRKIIIILKKENEAVDVWITEDPLEELKYQQENEVLEFRYWNGQKLSFER
jgi:hypothetical protein